MSNVETRREGSKLIITVDLSAKGVQSGSGKTQVIASTRGNADVPGAEGVKFGLNVFGYPGYDAGLPAKVAKATK